MANFYARYPAVNVTIPAGGATAANQVLEISAIESLADKSASGIVSEAFDYQAINYVGATTDVSSIVYKTGGSSGTVVATVSYGYDGSNRLNSITKS